MKKTKLLLTVFIMLLLLQQGFSQTPQKFSYQGICRDNTGAVVQNQAVNIRLTVHDINPAGTIAYQETFAITTNQFGLITLDVGNGTVQSGIFATIPWETGDKFLEVEMDLGSGYLSMGTTQLLSVPYALHAKSAETITGTVTESDPIFNVSPANGITTPDILNWNTVYGWGNHSTAGYITSEIDGSVTNEIQVLSISNDTLYLSSGGFVKLPAGFNGQYSSLTGTPSNVSAFTNDAGYLTSFTEIDGSITNEIQALSISNDTIRLSNGGFVILPAGFNGQYSSLIGAPTNVSAFTNNAGYLTSFTELDGSVTNELQALSISNDTIRLSNGGFVKLPAGFNGQYSSLIGAPTNVSAFTNNAGYLTSFTEVDGSVTNEIQLLSISNDTIYLSNGGFVKIPATAWLLTGNSGTIDGTNFIGTKDNVPFNIRVNNQKAGRIDQNGSTFLGYQTGNSITTGLNNTAIGYNTLYSNTSGNENTAIGSKVLYLNTTGYYNTSSGYQSLYSNTSGYSNTANGWGALYTNTIGYNNTAIGVVALTSNTTGNDNTAVGLSALRFNTTGIYNTTIGSQSLIFNTTGNNNTASGALALFSNTIGNNNTANGMFALHDNISGSSNTASGWYALNKNTVGNNNTAMGEQSLYWCNGIANSGYGFATLQNNSTGNQNSVLGAYAGYNSTGSGNVYLGYQAGYSATGSNKLYIANNSANPPLIYGDFATGNVGIGTNAPNSRLDLGLGYGASGEKLIIYNDNTSGPLAGTKTGFYLDRFSLQNNVTFVFPTAPAFPGSYMIARKNTAGTLLESLMTILGESGNVGIGTTTPNTKFQVYGNSGNLLKLQTSNVMNTAGQSIGITFATSADTETGRIEAITESNGNIGMRFYTYSGGVNERLRISSTGNVGIGTVSPTTKLEVSGGLKVTGGLNSDKNIILRGGNNTGTAIGGDISIAGGDGYNARGGILTLYAGFTSSWAAAGTSSDVTIRGGEMEGFSYSQIIVGGGKSVSGGSTSADGGVLTLQGGNANGSNRNGGNIILTPGTQTGTGTMGKILMIGLPVFANNAAAIAGGLPVGAIYRTGADPDPICVVH